MSFDGGGIHYTIDVETQALLDAKSVTAEATTQIQNAMARTELAVKNYSDELKKMGYIVAANGTVMQKNGAIMEAQTLHMQNLQNATINLNTKLKSTQPAFAVSGNAAQMAGYQIGDFATQVASGQSALIAFTQQATQLLGAFGVAGAVAGAVLAVAGALTVALAPALLKGRDYSKELEDSLKSLDEVMQKTENGTWELTDSADALAEKYTKMSGAMKRVVEVDMLNAVSAASGKLTEMIEVVNSANTSWMYFFDVMDDATTSKKIMELGKEFGLTGAAAYDAGAKIFYAMQRLKEKPSLSGFRELTELMTSTANQAGNKFTPEMSKLYSEMMKLTTEVDKATEAFNKFDEAIAKKAKGSEIMKDLADKTAIMKAEMEGGEIAAAKMATALELNLKAGEKLSPEIEKAIENYYKYKKALDDKTKADKEAEAFADKAWNEAKSRNESQAKEAKTLAEKRSQAIKNIVDGLEAERLKLSMTTLQWELYSKTQEAIKNGASQDVIQQIWDQVTAIDALRTKTAEAKAEEDKAEAARKERLRQLADKTENVTDKNKEFNRSQMDPIQALKDEQQEELKVLVDAYNSKLIAYDEYNKAMTDTLKRHSDERRQVELDNNMQLLSASAGFFDDMSKLAAMGGKKAFAAQKIFATASAALNFSSALAQAMADPSAITLPQKLANYGLVVSTFTSLLGSIKGSSYGGGRMYGGPVEAGRYYRINETGAPEIYSAGGKDYLMATENAKIKSAAQVAQGGGFSGNIIVNNAPPGTTASYNGRDVIVDIAKSEAEKAAAAVYNKMTNEASQNNGRFMNALNRNIASKGLA